MYELLHVMPESAEAVGAVISFLARSGMEQGEIVLEVSRRLQDLQGMCVTSTSHACVWTYTGAGQPDAHDRIASGRRLRESLTYITCTY